MSSCRMTWQEVRESGEKPSSAATRRVGMWVGWGVAVKGGVEERGGRE